MTTDIDNNAVRSVQKFRKSIKNRQVLVPNLLDAASWWLARAGVQREKITDIQIVLAEALNNVIEHGFSCDNAGNVHVDIEVYGKSVVVNISDNGVEFSPPEATQTPLQSADDIDHLPEGGFGWFLIRQITTSFTFQRIADKNCLVLNFQ